MRKLCLLILFLYTAVLAVGQTVDSRNNYTGLWNRRYAWMQEWGGRLNTNPLPATAANVYGYLTHGTTSVSADMTMSGTGSVMRVYDTLRVHGNFAVISGAHLIVESTGVLIIHGRYDQYDWGRLTIYGKMVVLGDLKLVGSTRPSETFGSLYVGGSSSLGGWPLNPKTLSQLAAEDPATSYFSRTSVMGSYCTGANSGAVNVTLPTTRARITRWEESYDYFKTDIRNIQHTNTQYTFTNKTRTISYRAFINHGDGTSSYSNGTTVIVEGPVTAGTISGQGEVCGSAASISLQLNNNTGDVIRWEWSNDDFITAPQTLVTNSERVILSNVTSTTWLRAVVKGCNEAVSPVFTVSVRQPVSAAFIQSPPAVCAGSNSGTLRLQNLATGTILRWESSTDGFKTVTSIANTTSSLAFSNLSQNTSYRVVVSDGSVCAESFTSSVEVKVIQNLSESTLAISETQAPASGLIAHYPFIKNASDASATGNHGIIVGATPVADRFGRANNAFAFDGVDDFMTTTSSFPAPGPASLSLSLWFKTSSTTGGKLIGGGKAQLGGSANYDRHIYLSNNGQLHFGIYRAELYPSGQKIVSSTGTYTDGVWHHVVATLSSAGMKLYIDGVLQASDPTYTSAEDYSGFWRVGYDNLGGWPNQPTSSFYAGSLDDIYIYNRELSLAEISQLHKTAAGPFCEGQNIQLMAAGVPGATYTWTGPNGFSSSLQNPALTNFLIGQAGTYKVSVKTGSCEYVGQTTVAAQGGGTVVASQSTVCAGANTGTLRLGNYTGTIVRWESSSDNFVSNIVAIANSTAEQTFTNLTATTSYRAVVKSSSCGEGYSAATTVTVIAQSQGGSLSGPASVCKGTNGGILTLGSHVGTILNWEYSDDGFATHVQGIAHTANTFSFTNLSASRWYRVVVQNGLCAPVKSTIFKVTVSEIAGGSLSGPERVCAGTNSGVLSLSNQAGTVIRWEWSKDGFAAHVQSIAHAQASYTFSNLTADTWYRVVVGNAECSEATSTVHVVRTDAQSQGGTISGTVSVCKGVNSGTLSLSGSLGSILSWEYSDDGFVAHSQVIANNTTSFSFNNLTANRWYRAIVQNGLCSQVYSAVHQVAVTEIAGGSVSGPGRVCESANTGLLQLNNHQGQIKRWEWSNDGFQNHLQTIAHAQASYTFNNLSGDTWFRAVVSNTECGEKASAAFVVRYDLLSLGGTISGTSSLCKGTNSGTLNLAGQRGQILRWEYSTDDFASHAQAVANTSTIHTFSNITVSRWYRVVVQNGSCAIVYSPSYKITVSELAGGTLSGPTVVCESDNSGTLMLQDYTGNILRWESSTDNFSANIQAIAHTAATYSFTNLAAETWYRVVVGNSDCGETFSTTWKVSVDVPSLGGDLTGATSFCSTQNSGTLQLQNHFGVVLRWEASTDDFSTHIQSIANTTDSYSFSNLQQSTSFRAVVQNGSCAPAYSAVAKVVVGAATQAGAVAGSASVCYGNNAGELVLENKVGAVLHWERSVDGFATINIINSTAESIAYQNLQESTSYRALVQNGSCEPAYSQPASISVSDPALAGNVVESRVVVAGDNSGELLLQAYSGQILYWESSTDDFVGDITQIPNTSATQSYLNLVKTSWYRAVLQSGVCAAVRSASAKVQVNNAPNAQADTLQVQDKNFTASVSVLANDLDPDGDALSVTAHEGPTAAGGHARLDASGVLYYEAPPEFFGYDSLRYTVCDPVAGAQLCAEATIVLDLSLPVVVYQGVSPNGDGANDFWFIGFIERYPDNLVQLYDRFGSLVYEQRGYNNLDKSFAGKSNKGLRPGGDELPGGTYYYKVITSAQAPVLQGYIVLKK